MNLRLAMRLGQAYVDRLARHPHKGRYVLLTSQEAPDGDGWLFLLQFSRYLAMGRRCYALRCCLVVQVLPDGACWVMPGDACVE